MRKLDCPLRHPEPRRRIWVVLVTALAIGPVACDRQGDEPFYEPPSQHRAESPSAQACDRWSRLSTLPSRAAGPLPAIVEALQAEFLGSGFDEIRIDPMETVTREPEQQIALTTSIRGRERQALLVAVAAPPRDGFSGVAWRAAAKELAREAALEHPPSLTTRFALLPLPAQGSSDRTVGAYAIAHYRSLARTKAVIVLDPESPTETLQTNSPELAQVLGSFASGSGLELKLIEPKNSSTRSENGPAHDVPSADMLSEGNRVADLGATFARLGRPTVWLHLDVTRPSNGACTAAQVQGSNTATAVLMELLEELDHALASPEDDSASSDQLVAPAAP